MRARNIYLQLREGRFLSHRRSGAADGFRQEVIAYLWSATRRGESVSYSSYEPLKEAIEKKLMNSVCDISRIITKARTRDERPSDGKLLLLPT